MQLILNIDVTSLPSIEKEKVENKHLWYDPYEKELKEIHGGHLTFIYDGEKLVPQAVKTIKNKYVYNRNHPSIDDFYLFLSREFNVLEISSMGYQRSFLIDCKYEDKEKIEDELYSRRLRYDWDDV